MKALVKAFLINGLVACGCGPVILSIIYSVLGATGTVDVIPVWKVVMEYLSVTVLAFIAGGINVVYKIEKLPLTAAIFIHGLVLYLDYIVIYLTNGWLKSGALPIAIFTACFILGFAAVWIVIYLTTKRSADRLNERLKVGRDLTTSDRQ